MKTGSVSTALLVALAAKLAEAADDSATDIYDACNQVFKAMVSTSKKVFDDKSIDDDKVMSSLLCPLTRTMAESVETAIKNTLDGTDDQEFENARDGAVKQGKKFTKIVYDDNKYVCSSMNKLTKNLKHARAIDETNMKGTYTILGNGIIDVSDACIKEKDVETVVCPVVEDLIRAVKMFSNIVDDSANGKKIANEVIEKGQKLAKEVKCDKNKEFTKALDDCASNAGVKTTGGGDDDAKATKTKKSEKGGGADTTSECTTSTTTTSECTTTETPNTKGKTSKKPTGPTKGTGVGNGGGYTPTHDQGGGWWAPSSTPCITTSTSVCTTTKAPATTSSEDCDCEKDGDKKSTTESGKVETRTDADGKVYTTVPFYAQGNGPATIAPYAAAAFAAVVMPLL